MNNGYTNNYIDQMFLDSKASPNIFGRNIKYEYQRVLFHLQEINEILSQTFSAA